MSAANRLRKTGRFAGGLFAILAVWFTALTAVPVMRDEPGQYLVIGPEDQRHEALRGTPAQLISAGLAYTHIASPSPGLVAQLYTGGAWLVLPAGNGGCLRFEEWTAIASIQTEAAR